VAVLVESHRCQVVLKLDDTVSIQPITDDEPTTAADGNVQWDSLAVETVEQPGGIVFVGAPSQYQLDFELEAVGVDVDGSVRPIGELSYRPDIAGAASAWSLIDLPFFNSLVDRLQRQLARESLFRWYRVKAAQGIDHAIEQCALLPHRLAAAHSDGAQQYISQPQVFGIWHDPQRDGTFDDSAAELMPLPLGPSDSATDTCCSVPFEFDSEARLIKFARPVYQLLADDGSGYQLAPATLMLRTAAHLLESNGSFRRFEYRRDIGEPGSAPCPAWHIRRPELLLQATAQYGANYELLRFDENATQLERICEQLFVGIERGLRNRSRTIAYAGLQPIELCGAIRHVAWSISLAGVTTQTYYGPGGPLDRISDDEIRFLDGLQPIER
jgi:hypothetical protein